MGLLRCDMRSDHTALCEGTRCGPPTPGQGFTMKIKAVALLPPHGCRRRFRLGRTTASNRANAQMRSTIVQPSTMKEHAIGEPRRYSMLRGVDFIGRLPQNVCQRLTRYSSTLVAGQMRRCIAASSSFRNCVPSSRSVRAWSRSRISNCLFDSSSISALQSN